MSPADTLPSHVPKDLNRRRIISLWSLVVGCCGHSVLTIWCQDWHIAWFIASKPTIWDQLELKGLQAVLEPTKGDQVKHFAWTGTKDAAPIVHTKSNLCKTIFKVVLRQHFELIDLGHPDKFIDTIWKIMGKLGFWVTNQVCGAFADTTKLLCLWKACSSVTTKTVVVALSVTNDEWYIWVKHNRMNFSIVV